jgi:hypothetical protein
MQRGELVLNLDDAGIGAEETEGEDGEDGEVGNPAIAILE